MLLYWLFNFKISENSSRVLQVTDVNLLLVQFLLKTVYGFFPTTDVNLSTCPDATFENSLRTLPNNGCCSIAYSTSRLLKTVYGFFPTTDVNLSLVQMQFLKTVYGFPKHRYQSIAYSRPPNSDCSKTWTPF